MEPITEKKQPLIVILGPTAVGKTKLSIELAKVLKAQIISGDSMLVYRGFDIGTAKPSIKERDGVKHYLIDICDGSEKFDAVEFCRLASQLIDEMTAKGQMPIIAGGTGLYLKALLEGYKFNAAPEDTAYRKYLENLAQEKGKAYVHDLLAKVDAETAARLHTNDLNRVIRALEVHRYNKERISTGCSFSQEGALCYDALVIGLERERAHLYERINRRVEIMLEQGFVAEVEGLLQKGHTREERAMNAIGYKQINAYLAGECSLEEATDETKKVTRHFAKRQLTWYRKMPYIDWLDANALSDKQLLEKAIELVKKKFSKQ